MITLPKFTEIDKLVHWEFPELHQFRADRFLKGIPYTHQEKEELKALQIKAEQYRLQLQDLPHVEIQALYAKAKRANDVRIQINSEHREKNRFFNLPESEADFDFWSKTAHWTLDEACALSFGKDPNKVSWKNIEPYTKICYTSNPPEQPSYLAIEYQKRRELMRRAKIWQQLYDPIIPALFIGWMKQSDLYFPEELEKLVIARGGKVGSWKIAYDNLEKTNNANVEAYNRLKSEAEAQLAEAREIIANLTKERDDLKAESHVTPQAIEQKPTKPFSSREQETLLKICLGMAMSGYKYNPKLQRNVAITEIAQDLDNLGIAVSDDTIRAKLKAASALLPYNE